MTQANPTSPPSTETVQTGETTSLFKRGDRVRKIKGYKFEGRVNGSFAYFDKDDAPLFVNVQHDDGWIMHFRENELELASTGYRHPVKNT